MPNRYIPILSDYGFKVTFANEKNTLFLRKAIQALIQSPTAIEEVRLSRNEFAGVTKESRGGLYDLICTDAQGNTFIVEMQLGTYPQFIQRSKFYAFQKFNTLVIKGNYRFENLSRIYCIGILGKNIFPHEGYYHFCQLKNQEGEIIDEQMFHIVVEIAKFNEPKHHIKRDLDKLIYTMKHIHKVTEPIEWPEFWTEEWIEIAIQQLDTHNLSPDERAAYEMTLAHNASVIQMLKEEEKKERLLAEKERLLAEKERLLEQERQKAEQERQKAEQEKRQTIQKLLHLGMFTDEQIAELANTTQEEVQAVRQSL